MPTPIRSSAGSRADSKGPVFLSESELATRWRVSTRFVRQLRAERRIDFVRLGRRVIYPTAAVELYEQEQLVEARVVTMPRQGRNA